MINYLKHLWEAHTGTACNTNQRQKKNKAARVVNTAKVTFQGLYRDVLHFNPDKAAAPRG